jgi:hypothetical protein
VLANGRSPVIGVCCYRDPEIHFVGFLIELLVVKRVDTISLLILNVMSLFDVLIGFTVTISSARRNITLDNG